METIGSNIRASEDEHLTGIAGWLTFALIIQCLTTVGLVFTMVGPFFSPPVSAEGWMDVGSSGLLLLFSAWVLFNFFGHKRRTRVLAIIFHGIVAALSILGLVMFFGTSASNVSVIESGGPIRGLIISLGLLGYFIRSRRVKNTFVN